jgi:hypothetical protein
VASTLTTAPPRQHRVGKKDALWAAEMAYGKIRVGNPKNQDTFRAPYFFYISYLQQNQWHEVNNKCKKINNKFWEELIRLISLHKSFMLSMLVPNLM